MEKLYLEVQGCIWPGLLESCSLHIDRSEDDQLAKGQTAGSPAIEREKKILSLCRNSE
jgi:hypothetical protein